MKIAKLAIFLFLISIIAAGCTKKTTETTGLIGLGIEGEDKDVITQTVTSPEPEQQAESKAQPIQVQPVQLATVEVKTAATAQKTQAVPMPSGDLERNMQIQTALKNANLYLGDVDGKIGPLTRKAIEEFQKQKGLKADGKVGPITWAELQKYLNVSTGTKKKR